MDLALCKIIWFLSQEALRVALYELSDEKIDVENFSRTF